MRLHALLLVLFAIPALAINDPPPKLGLQFDSRLIQRMKEYSHASWNFAIDANYEIYAPIRLGARTEFFNTFSRYQEDGHNYAFEDTQLYILHPEIAKNRAWDLVFSTGFSVVLPTSKASQEASLRAGYLVDFNITREWRYFKAALNNRVYFLDHKYTTANASGDKANYYFALRMQLEMEYEFLPHLSLYTMGELFHPMDYRDHVRTLFQVKLGPEYQVSEVFSLYLHAAAKDRMVSTLSFLDDDTLRVEAGLRFQL